MALVRLPPLSLYIHLPWCVRKCPYCDFNSHAIDNEPPEHRYVDALLRDLEIDARAVEGRVVQTIFLGGGTPSLFRPESIGRLLTGVRTRVAVADSAEITLEANPGTIDATRFRGFFDAGVNRISIGVQSFDAEKLRSLGRIHGSAEALAAAELARDAGFTNINLDLMYGLPGQRVAEALADLETAIALGPTHLSVYQLTLEPNTLFHKYPPVLPDDETIDHMREALLDKLERGGYAQYEVSAYACSGWQCKHNRNYWEFGDYLGVGAGAHGKISDATTIVRTAKTRHPDTYLRDAGSPRARTATTALEPADLVFEFALNAFRLNDGFALALFTERTGLPIERIEPEIQNARRKGLIEVDPYAVRATALGRRFLNDLLMGFLPEPAVSNQPAGRTPLARHWNVC
jgi:putative oxygen-independent coproporphyrinogen III oxidase